MVGPGGTGLRRGWRPVAAVLLFATLAVPFASSAAADPPVFAVTPSALALPDLPSSSLGTYFVTLTLDPGYRFDPAGSGTGHPEGAIVSLEPGDAGTLRDCLYTAPGQSCLVPVLWQGTWTGASPSVTLTYSECAAGGGDCRTVAQAVTVGPGFARMPASFPAGLDFGEVPVGTTVTRDVTVSLDDGYRVNNAAFFGDPEFTFAFGSCDVVLGGPCTAHVTFAPTAVGTYTSHLGFDECQQNLPIITSCISNYVIPMPITGSAGRAPTTISLSHLRAGGGIETATLIASLTHAPLSHRTVTFTIGTRTVCTALTNSTGQAQCRFRATDAAQAVLAGQYQARFSGDANYLPITGRAGLLY